MSTIEKIQTVAIESDEYPILLKGIPDAPKILYYKGVLPTPKEQCVAVVGTRRPTPYGQQVALQIARELADAGLTIISGMAPGIDTFAHKVCVEKGARTIAVLGTGIDEKSIYPQQNVPLSREIVNHGGCLISEYPPGTPGYPANFPSRNRIVSALSLGTLIVEAKEKSGSLITANYAKKQGKKIFAVPGQIYTLNSIGPNRLIKEGATLVEGARDILDVLGIQPQKVAKQLFAAENAEELAILTSLKEEPLNVDTIIERTKLNASTVATALALMEISGKIRNLGGNTYSLN